MKFLKIFIVVVALIVLLVVILFGIYLLTHRQGVIKSLEIANPDATFKVLIASQGSTFKTDLVDSITARLKDKPVAVKVVDVTTLHQINTDDYNAFIIIHTVEKSQLQPDVKKFLDRIKDLKKILLVTTSGSGEWKSKDYNVDMITSASEKSDLRIIPDRITAWLDSVFKNNQ